VPDRRWPLEADRIEDLTFAGTRILLATAGLGCVELAGDHGLRPVWRPPAGQRLTGIAIAGDPLAYATVDAGCVVDVASGEIVAGDLSHPCAPRWHDGRLWLLESGRRGLCEIEIATGARRTVAELPGVPSGLALAGGVAVVCLSLARSDDRGGRSGSDDGQSMPRVCFIELATGARLGFVRFEGQISHVGSPVCLAGYESGEIAFAESPGK
jgi:hypothetical protein